MQRSAALENALEKQQFQASDVDSSTASKKKNNKTMNNQFCKRVFH